MLKKYVEMFNSIGGTSSRLEKESLLRKYQDDEGFLDILRFVYDPQIVTGLARRKIEKTVETVLYTPIGNIFDAMQYVADNNTGTDQVVCSLQHFLRLLETEEEKKLAVGILIKDMPYGISRTTINKIYGADFISKYSVQLAGRYNPDLKQFDGPFALTLKLDGNRCTFFTYEDGIKAYTRSGKLYEGLVELEEDFKALPKGMVYDGELIAENPNNLDSAELFRLTQTISRKKGTKTGLNFVMFDMLPISEFKKGKSKDCYGARMTDMGLLFATKVPETSHIKKVPVFYVGDDKSVIQEHLTKVVNAGFEGLMINTLDGHYQTKRTKELLKVKMFNTVDLRCVDVLEDIRGGRCGSIVCDYKGYRVSVAGLTDKDKEEFWNHPEKVVGKIVEVKYFEETSNALGGISLRFPNFKMIREDKNEVSYN